MLPFSAASAVVANTIAIPASTPAKPSLFIFSFSFPKYVGKPVEAAPGIALSKQVAFVRERAKIPRGYTQRARARQLRTLSPGTVSPGRQASVEQFPHP